jgi:hypothetical protein
MQPETRAGLTQRIQDWISTSGGDHAILLITVDDRVRPHVMLLAREEVSVASESSLRIRLREASRSAENLRRRSSATLCLYDAGLACAIKTHTLATSETSEGGVSTFTLSVEEVRLDAPLDSEGPARLASGLRFERSS